MESLIGEGGMGAVIKARHLELEESVAIKCLLPEMMDRKDIVARFVREGKAAVKLKGKHVARVIDVGRLENQVPYIVMEYLEGADLNAIIKHHGSQDAPIAVDLVLQACEAIAEAHSLGIIHRDIKASNFFITQPENQAPTLKVLDFGIATAPEGTSDLTSTQSVIGTPAYMAPEQMRSSRTADARSDIWSIGVVLYELLEGARPFRSEVYSELVLKVGMDPPIPMENPAIPDALRAVTLKCLEKPVEKRYQSVAELAFDLMPFASDPVSARAAVEQCARLLGRRGSRIFDVPPHPDGAPKTPTGSVPAPYVLGDEDSGPVPKRITPAKSMAVPPSTPISSSQPSLPAAPSSVNVLGRPTPVGVAGQPKTPTSINVATGEVTLSAALPVAPRSRRGVVIGITAMAMLLVGGVGVYIVTGGDSATTAAVTPPATPNPEVTPNPAVTPAPDPPKLDPKREAPKPAVKDPEPVAETPEPIAKPAPPVVVKNPPKKAPPVVRRVVPNPTPRKKDPKGSLYEKRE